MVGTHAGAAGPARAYLVHPILCAVYRAAFAEEAVARRAATHVQRDVVALLQTAAVRHPAARRAAGRRRPPKERRSALRKGARGVQPAELLREIRKDVPVPRERVRPAVRACTVSGRACVCVCVKYGASTGRKRKERGQGERPAAMGSFTAPAGRLTGAAPRWEDRHVCGGRDGHAPLTVLPIAVFKSLSLLRSCSISPAIVVTFDEDAPGPPPLDMPPPPASFPAMCVNRHDAVSVPRRVSLAIPPPPAFFQGTSVRGFPLIQFRD